MCYRQINFTKGVNPLDTIEELAKIARTRPEKLKEQKEKGVKLIGYIGRFVPEELIMASGALPYLLCRGGQPEPPDAVMPYLIRFYSPYSRSQIGYHFLGIDPMVPILDLIVIQASDCHEARLADVIEYCKLPLARLGVPPDWEKSLSRDYYQRQLILLKEKLEAQTGHKITDEKLRGSIETTNKIRAALRKIDLLRRERPPKIGGYDFIKLNHHSFYCAPETAIVQLDNLYQQLQKGKSPFSGKEPRILLAGHVVAVGDYVVPKLIEDSGGVIVTELLDEGMRQCAWNVKTDGDLIKGLAETYYLERTPPSIFQPAWEKRIESIKKLIADFGIDGVIWYQLTFDEIYSLESNVISEAMENMNMPFLKLESSYEYAREAMGPLTTRIESFIESIKQKRSR
jgi:benzoyl-CoA reductase/2-hydroxyglutaryl-CoA dehydratase subunit BcrC/BadD/HgdB